MKIKKIETIPISLELKEPFVIGNVTNKHMHYVITKITSSTGIEGYSEVIPAWEVTGETQAGTISAINLFQDKVLSGDTLIGKRINSLEDIKILYESTIDPSNGTQTIWGNPSAKCGLECALLDVVAKKEGVPVYRLLGGAKKEVVLPLVLGIYDVNTTIEKALKGVSDGYRTIKLKIGRKNVGGLTEYQRDIEVINRLAEELKNRNITLVADANQGYIDAETSIKIINQFSSNLSWVEQPVLAEDIFGLKKVRSKVNIPIMADEAAHSYHNAKTILELEAADYVNIKLMKSSGILGAMRIAEICAEKNVICQIGSMLESTLGTAMGMTAYMCSENIKTNELVGMTLMKNNIGRGVNLENNIMNLSDESGFGVKLEDCEFERFKTRSNYSANKTVRSYGRSL